MPIGSARISVSEEGTVALLELRHTRTHMPTRRIALAYADLPTAGAADGLALLEALVTTFVPLLDDEARDAFPDVIAAGRAGRLPVPGIALRYRLQTDTHGLDYSRHRIVREPLPGFELLAPGERPQASVIELDTHASAAPQLLGAVLAATRLSPTARGLAFRAIGRAARGGVSLRPGYILRLLPDGVPRGQFRFAPGPATASFPPNWDGIETDQRWAMEVFGLRPDIAFNRQEVQRRFRRLLRLSHPDQGADQDGAGERISDLAEARAILLDAATTEPAEI